MAYEMETEKVYLRNFQEKDLNDFFSYAKVKGVGEKAGWKHHKNIEESKSILYNHFLLDPYTFAIVEKKKNHVIGSISIKKETEAVCDLKKDRVAEIGYVLSKKYQNQGIMTNVVSKLTNAIFQKDEFDVLVIQTGHSNYPSQKIALKNGYIRYKIKDAYLPGIGKIEKSFLFCKLKANETKSLL